MQLTAPKAAEVAVDLAVVVLEDARVDAEGTTDGVFLGNERPFGTLAGGYAQVKDTVVVLSREDEVVTAILYNCTLYRT